MNLQNNYFRKARRKQLIVDMIIYIVLIMIAFYGGYSYRQLEVISNAQQVLETKKTVFDIQDLEIIIFD